MRKVKEFFFGELLEDEEDKKKRIKRNILCICVPILVILLLVSIPLINRYLYQIKGQIDNDESNIILSMGSTELTEPVKVPVDKYIIAYHQEWSISDAVSEVFSANKYYEMINTLHSLATDISYENSLKKINEIIIPQEATYVSVNKKASNDFEYYTDLGSGLNFDLLNWNVEMYGWHEDYINNMNTAFANEYIVFIVNEDMLIGRIYKVGNTKSGMEVIIYHISK